MQNLSLESMRLGARRLLLLQALIVLVLVAVTAIWFTRSAAVAVLYGGVTCMIVSYLFMKIFFRSNGATSAHAIVLRMYLGEFLKLAILGICFTTLIWHHSAMALPFVISYFIVQASQIFSPLIFKQAGVA